MFFHGSTHKIAKFTDEFVGGKEANDQEGPGIYFTSSWKNARSYGGYIYTVKLNPRKVVSTEDGKKASVKELTWLIKQAPNWQETAQNWNENPILGLKQVVSDTLEYNDNPHQQFQQVWVDFYRYHPADYVRNMVKLGYDLIYIPNRNSMISGEENIIHAVVLNPDIIEFVEMEDDRTDEEKTLNEIRKLVRKTLNEGPIWNQGGIVLIKGEPIEDGTQKLYATSVRNLIEIKPGQKEKLGPLGSPSTPAKDAVKMAVLGDDFFRIKYDDKGDLKAFKVGWKNEPSLAKMLSFKNHKVSVVLNNNKTPLHWETLQFKNIGMMLNQINSQILGINNVNFF